MKRFLFSLTAIILPLLSIAQNFAYDQVTAEELNMTRYDKDTSAHAVVLQEYGLSKMQLDADGYIRLYFEYHVKTKIFDNRGFNKGTIEIPLLSTRDLTERVKDLTGYTEYIDDAGKVQTIKLDADYIYNQADNKSRSHIKFAFPGLRKGCVIEYTYKLATPFYGNFKTWVFQTDIPKIRSEYEMEIPSLWHFNLVIRGALQPTKKLAEVEKGCFLGTNGKSDCLHVIYSMNNVPGFVSEDFMTSPKNFLSAIYFEMAEHTDLSLTSKRVYAHEWTDVDDELKHLESFGGQLEKARSLKKELGLAITGSAIDMDKAKAVYAFIKKSIKWNNYYSAVSSKGILKAVEQHTGNSGDINLALVSSLNAVGLNATAVLLSTRNNGVVNKLFPTMEDFDYVVAQVTIGTKTYFLDATEPLLGFGVLPLRCLNGEGRVMDQKKPSYWTDISTNQKELTVYTLDLTIQANGKISGTGTRYSNGYAAYLKRREIKKFNSLDEYIESHEQPASGRLHISKLTVDNLDSLDKPVVEHYELEFDIKQNTSKERLTINPFTFDHLTSNPFKLAERNYPVDMGMPNERRYILTMHLPENYAIEETIKPESMALPNLGGKFVSDFQQHDNIFVYSHITQFSKSVYWPNEYASLKEFYNKIIQAERQHVVLKKQ